MKVQRCNIQAIENYMLFPGPYNSLVSVMCSPERWKTDLSFSHFIKSCGQKISALCFRWEKRCFRLHIVQCAVSSNKTLYLPLICPPGYKWVTLRWFISWSGIGCDLINLYIIKTEHLDQWGRKLETTVSRESYFTIFGHLTLLESN